MDKTQRKIISEISKERNVEKSEVETIIKDFFKQVRLKIEKGEHDNFESFRTVRIPKFGSLYPHKGKFDAIIKQKKKKENGKQS